MFVDNITRKRYMAYNGVSIVTNTYQFMYSFNIQLYCIKY